MNPKKIKLTMLETRRGYLGPYQPYAFYAGRTFNVPKSLANKFINEGIAEVVEAEKVKEAKPPVKKKKISKE